MQNRTFWSEWSPFLTVIAIGVEAWLDLVPSMADVVIVFVLFVLPALFSTIEEAVSKTIKR